MNNGSDKLKSYNQLLLAILGTGTILFFAGLLAVFLWDEFRPSSYHDYPQTGVIANEVAEELAADSVRKQIISFNTISLIDSATKTYILPVIQSNLKGAEFIDYDDNLLGLTNKFTSYKSYKSYGKPTFNNLVRFESITNRSSIIFDQRISISYFQKVKHVDKNYLIILATNEDSNADSYWNEDDLQDLYIYDVQSRQLTKVPSTDRFTAKDIYKNPKTGDIIAHFGLDRDEDGKFDRWVEPTMLYTIDLSSKTMHPIVPAVQIDQLQKLLEGRG